MGNLFGSTRKWAGKSMNDTILLVVIKFVLVVTCGIMVVGLLRAALLSVLLGV
nr:MAG TPA: hypothetical protein [Caudoviricetes sp.]